MACGESNGHVTEEVTKGQIVTTIRLQSNISKTAGDAIQQQSLIHVITRKSVARQYGRLS